MPTTLGTDPGSGRRIPAGGPPVAERFHPRVESGAVEYRSGDRSAYPRGDGKGRTRMAQWNWNWISHGLVAAAMILGALQLVVIDQPLAVDLLIPVALGIAVANARVWGVWLVPTFVGVGVACFDWSKDELGYVSAEILFYDRLGLFIVQTCLVAVAVVVGQLVRVNRRLRQVRRAEQEQTVRAAVLAERGRISTEMHDIVGHGLGLIVVASEAARYLAQAPAGEVDLDAEERLASISDALDQIHATAVRSLSETRTLVHALGEDAAVTSVQPGLADIRGLVDNARQAGQPAQVSIAAEVTEVDLGAPAQAAVYRCVQESLTNALRHAPGAEVRARLEVCDGHLVWRAVNASDGAPIVEGNGMTAMRQRMVTVGGSLEVANDGDGFVVEARVPLKETR